MATRYRWYSVKFGKKGLEQIVALLAASSFSENTDSGFALIERSRDAVSFKFFARTSIAITKVDSEFNTSYDHVETLGISDFSVVSISGAMLLRADNPGKNMRLLFNTLGRLIGLGFTVSPIVFVKHIPKAFLPTLDVHRLVTLRVRGIIPGSTVRASMELQSKEGLTAEQLPFPSGFEYQVLQAVYNVKHKMAKGQIAYFCNGMVRMTGELDRKLVGLVEHELAQLVRDDNLFQP